MTGTTRRAEQRTEGAKAEKLWEHYREMRAARGRFSPRFTQNDVMTEDERTTQGAFEPQDGASGSLDKPAEGEVVEKGLPQEFSSDKEVKRLVSLAQDGDADSLNELFTRYYHVLVQTARRLPK